MSTYLQQVLILRKKELIYPGIPVIARDTVSCPGYLTLLGIPSIAMDNLDRPGNPRLPGISLIVPGNPLLPGISYTGRDTLDSSLDQPLPLCNFSGGHIDDLFHIFFPEDRFLGFMQIVSKGESLCFSYVCSICACLDLSVSSSSWGLGRAAVCDCGTPWTFFLPFFANIKGYFLEKIRKIVYNVVC